MFSLTSYERKALIFILGVLLAGAALHYLLRVQALNKFFYKDMLVSVESPQSQALIKVNLNTASVDELTKLKGIGPSLAERIVAYRTEHGPFTSIDELAKVKGIGQKKLLRIKNSLIIP